MPDPVLRARGLRKAHGRGRAARVVLDGVDVDVAAGELVAIVGRSGQGKSTLLQLLGGLDDPDGGTVEVAGRRLTGVPETERAAVRRDLLGFVFQFFHLVPELDGEANVLLPAQLPGARRDAARRGRELVDRLGLRDVAALLPHQLSGGEQQRFALARALVADPPVVLADEPIGNLDAAAGALVLDLLRGLADEGRAVVMVTHQAEATAVADRILRLEDGVLAADGGRDLVDHEAPVRR
jgi:ABC-type lipoprotein export system ATPase subunit